MKFLLIMNNKMNMSGAGAIMEVGRFDDSTKLIGKCKLFKNQAHHS